MSPLAGALDILQGEKEMYTAFLLPVISSLPRQIKNVENRQKYKIL